LQKKLADDKRLPKRTIVGSSTTKLPLMVHHQAGAEDQ
jgi:hypothetical protein